MMTKKERSPSTLEKIQDGDNAEEELNRKIVRAQITTVGSFFSPLVAPVVGMNLAQYFFENRCPEEAPYIGLALTMGLASAGLYIAIRNFNYANSLIYRLSDLEREKIRDSSER